MRTTLFLLAALFLGACASPTRYDFDVSVKNATTQPLTIGFTKTGPPDELQWMPPELTYFRSARPTETWGRMVAPGEIATCRMSGRFYKGVYAMLRIYGGEHMLTDLLAVSHDPSRRLDLILEPGDRNTFVIDERAGQLSGKVIGR